MEPTPEEDSHETRTSKLEATPVCRRTTQECAEPAFAHTKLAAAAHLSVPGPAAPTASREAVEESEEPRTWKETGSATRRFFRPRRSARLSASCPLPETEKSWFLTG